MKKVFLDANEGAKLALRVYEAKQPKAVVQVLHGMCENQNRYQYVAKKLCEAGYTVVTADMRGHGESVTSDNDLGYFGKKGYVNLLDDQIKINDYIRKNYPDTKVYMLAHSMGTLTSRNFIQQNDLLIDKLVLSGSPCYVKVSTMGLGLIKLVKLFSRAKGRSKLLNGIVFGQIPKEQKEGNAWLSHNQQSIDEYNKDPKCGFYFTNAGYESLVQLVKGLHNFKNYAVKNPGLDIMFLSGNEDFITGDKKDVADSVETLIKMGYKNVSLKVYNNMKHEILQEIDRDKVINDIVDFFEK